MEQSQKMVRLDDVLAAIRQRGDIYAQKRDQAFKMGLDERFDRFQFGAEACEILAGEITDLANGATRI